MSEYWEYLSASGRAELLARIDFEPNLLNVSDEGLLYTEALNTDPATLSRHTRIVLNEYFYKDVPKILEWLKGVKVSLFLCFVVEPSKEECDAIVEILSHNFPLILGCEIECESSDDVFDEQSVVSWANLIPNLSFLNVFGLQLDYSTLAQESIDLITDAILKNRSLFVLKLAVNLGEDQAIQVVRKLHSHPKLVSVDFGLEKEDNDFEAPYEIKRFNFIRPACDRLLSKFKIRTTRKIFVCNGESLM
jgi:hypothetical protein